MNKKFTDFLKEPLSDGRLKLIPSLLVLIASIFINAYFQVTSFSALVQWFLKTSGEANVQQRLAEILSRSDTPVGIRIAFGLLMTAFVMVFLLLAAYWEDGLFLANVTFEPGCRNNWHIHHAKKGGGQILVCTAGEGWYQEEGKEAVSLLPGSVIAIPANVKHWHGARKDSWFSHIAIEVNGEGCKTEWCEPVADEDYQNLM